MKGEGSARRPFALIAGSGWKRSAGGGRSGQRKLPGQVNPIGGGRRGGAHRLLPQPRAGPLGTEVLPLAAVRVGGGGASPAGGAVRSGAGPGRRQQALLPRG